MLHLSFNPHTARISIPRNAAFFAFFLTGICLTKCLDAQSLDSSSQNTNNSVNQPSHPFHSVGSTIASTGVKMALGTGGGLFGLLLGGVAGAGVEEAFWGKQDLFPGLEGFVIGAFLGYLFLEPASICAGANLMNEKGSYWGAFIGNAAGTLIGSGLVALIGAASSQSTSAQPYQIAIIITLPIAGSAIGYSHIFKPRNTF